MTLFDNLMLWDVDKRSQKLNPSPITLTNSLLQSFGEFRAAIRVNSMVAGMSSEGHKIHVVRNGESNSNRQEDHVSVGHDSCFH